MVFIGFGFLMAFLKTHSWTSIGFNYLVACWAIQCTMVFYGFWYQVFEAVSVEKIPAVACGAELWRGEGH